MNSYGKRLILGSIIIIFGILALLNNFGIASVDLSDILRTYWPLILIYWGITYLFNREGYTDYISSGILLFLGITFLGKNMNLFYFRLDWFWKLFWPAILILIGFTFLTGHKTGGKHNLAFWGGIEKKLSPWTLESGSYTAFMGGVELDLSIADIPDGETVMDLTAMMGGIDIIVPNDIHVISEGTAILGGIELFGKSTGGVIGSTKAELHPLSPSSKTLKIYCRAIMGGVEIKSQQKQRV